jgi:alkanesulfonate monooxygenase SsuD/methylene tetrahydromethanopterin reductase-like flavin-dependent oxidoreductase (luciferase family)
MTVEFGFRVSQFQPKGEDARAYYDRILPKLSDHFTGVWIEDHLMFDDHYLLESWVHMGYLAGAYPRFTYGHMVVCQSFRNPALLAKMAASLHALTGGKFVLSLGAGWHKPEYDAYNYDFATPGARVAQLAETIEIVRALWTQAPATYKGQYYQVENAYCSPRPDPLPRILIGTGRHKALAVTARLADAWNYDIGPNFMPAYETLKAECAAIGRDFSDLWLTATGQVHFPQDLSSYQAPEHPVFGPTPADAIAQLKTYIALGIRSFPLVFADLYTLQKFDAEVAPEVAGL